MVTPDVDELLRAAVTGKPLAKPLPPVDQKPKQDPYKGVPTKPPKKRTKPKPRKVWQKKPAKIPKEQRAKWERRWVIVDRIERRLPARKDRLIVAMLDDGLTWEQVTIITGMSKASIYRATVNVKRTQPKANG